MEPLETTSLVWVGHHSSAYDYGNFIFYHGSALPQSKGPKLPLARKKTGTSAPGPSEPPDAAPRRTAGAGPRPTQLGSGVHRRPRVGGPGARTRSCCLVLSTQLPDDRTTSFKKSNSVPRFVTNRGCHCGPSHLRLLLPSIASSSLLILLFF